MAIHDLSLYDVLLRNASLFGTRPALVTENGETRTFGELRGRVDRLAAGLAGQGIGHGDRLCVLAWNSATFFELYFACARLGAVVAPLNWRLKPEEIERLLERLRPKALLADTPNIESIPGRPGSFGIPLWIQIDDAQAVPGYRPVADLYEENAEIEPAEVSADDPLAIIATAAVDIVPRGALLSHRNLLTANLQEIAALSLGEEDGSLLALPLFHIAGLGHALSFFHAGGKNVVMPRFDAEQAVTLIDRHRLSHLSDFPPVLSQLLDAATQLGSNLPSLRHVTGLDAPETIARLEEHTDATFWTGFGQTETSGFVSLQRWSERPGAAGRPAELCRVRLVDDWDREVEVGTPGEILVRGPLVFLGYADEPEVTDHTFRNGWHHTGDVGRFDEDGFLWYVRRKPEKELIKPGGENVYPAEVEAVIVELEGVTGVCVFGVPHPRWGEGIKAVVEVETGCELAADTVIEHVGDRIARYKKPHFVELTDALPRTADGVVDREAVKEQWKPTR